MVDVLDWLATRNRTVQDAYAAGDRVPYDPLDARTYRSPVPVGANTERQLVGVLKMALRAAVQRRLLVFNTRWMRSSFPRWSGTTRGCGHRRRSSHS